jgi:hypothetical protein
MPRDREFLPDLQEGFRPRQPRTERGQFHPTLLSLAASRWETDRRGDCVRGYV